MKNPIKILGQLVLTLIIVLSSVKIFAQDQEASSKVLDGIYIKHRTKTRRVIPYPHIREADVMWHKRIWRVVDLRQKINYPLYYPTTQIQDHKSLFQIMKIGINEGTITAYGNPVFDDEFTVPMTIAEAKKSLSHFVQVMKQDTVTGQMSADSVKQDITSLNIKRYWIKEDWVFDKQRSVLDVRIVGLCPLREKLNDDGTLRGYEPLFWVYFPECRYVFANYEVFNPHNDAERLSFDDLFMKRMFSSYIRKQSNVYDRFLPDYMLPFKVLLKSKKIKNQMFNFEQDLWHY